jgi:hypothetical protein
VLLDRGLADAQRLGDADVRLALRHHAEQRPVSGGQRVKRVARSAASEHPADHLGVERAAARRHALDGVHEGRHVADALLEEVADTLGSVADEVQRVGRLGELGQDEDPGARQAAAQLHRRDEPVVLAPWGHPDVDDGHVRPVREPLRSRSSASPACATTSSSGSACSRRRGSCAARPGADPRRGGRGRRREARHQLADRAHPRGAHRGGRSGGGPLTGAGQEGQRMRGIGSGPRRAGAPERRSVRRVGSCGGRRRVGRRRSNMSASYDVSS